MFEPNNFYESFLMKFQQLTCDVISGFPIFPSVLMDPRLSLNLSSYQEAVDRSLHELHDFIPNQILHILVCSLNMAMNCLSLTVFITSPVFNQRSMFLIRALVLNDACLSFFMIMLNAWHLMNAITDVPEVMSRLKCCYITSPVGFFIGNNCDLSLLISIDR